MLVLTRYPNEGIVIELGGLVCEVTIFGVDASGRIRVGLDGPREISITRKELVGTDRARPRTPEIGTSEIAEPRTGGGIGWGPQS